jgi:hypothetical protein
MDNFDLKKYLAEGRLFKEEVVNETLEQDIQDFWDTLQDDAAQSDGEYEAKWDTDFFIDQYPEYEDQKNEINNIVKSKIPSLNKPSKSKGIEGEGSILDFVKQNLDSVADGIIKITGSNSDWIKKVFKDIKADPRLLTGDEKTAQVHFLDNGKMYDFFQIAFKRNGITDGGYKSKIVVDGKTLFVSV